ncbi:MarR family winged helix-turn-helix transcriptional regulator [Variovorax sp. GB1P17]|uniref:MarR family winged helix-turn-helix transcriptional regulator n=1 Tax=Variovorax sp. GB1P17 TaxID=3443740 RepID=UPI003F46E78A
MTEKVPLSTAPKARKTTAMIAVAVPPVRAASKPAPVDGSHASVNRFLSAYIMGVANRLANGASNHYRSRFNLGMSEWRAMMAVGGGAEFIVREVAEMADLDYAAASKSVRVLEERGFVSVEQTKRRGRAAIVRLTPEGTEIYRKLRDSARRRNKRLIDGFTAAEVEQLWTLLRRVERQVPHMNAE